MFSYKCALKFSALSLATLSLLTACGGPTPGPDKTVNGAVLGAAWGAGAGAVVGNQVAGSPTGEGAAIGAGFGLVSGALTGMGYDQVEDTQIVQARALESLKIQNRLNATEISNIQARLDFPPTGTNPTEFYQVYFDGDATSLRSGAVSQLESIADSIKRNAFAHKIIITGHSDDTGSPEHNQRLGEARARTVAAYMGMQGVPADQIAIASQGSTRPVASNATAEGRQLNRRVEIRVTQ